MTALLVGILGGILINLFSNYLFELIGKGNTKQFEKVSSTEIEQPVDATTVPVKDSLNQQ